MGTFLSCFKSHCVLQRGVSLTGSAASLSVHTLKNISWAASFVRSAKRLVWPLDIVTLCICVNWDCTICFSYHWVARGISREPRGIFRVYHSADPAVLISFLCCFHVFISWHQTLGAVVDLLEVASYGNLFRHGTCVNLVQFQIKTRPFLGLGISSSERCGFLLCNLFFRSFSKIYQWTSFCKALFYICNGRILWVSQY